MKSDETTYEGSMHDNEALVIADGEYLNPAISRKVYDHSREFAWGYRGSGPAQLSLAILLDFFNDATDPHFVERALHHHQAFKEVLASFGCEAEWKITGRYLRATIEALEMQRPFIPVDQERH